MSPDVGSPSRSEGQNMHSEPSEEKPYVLSESSLLLPDSISEFHKVDQLATKQRAKVDPDFEKLSSNYSTAVETKHLRGNEAASLEISKHGNGQESHPQQAGPVSSFVHKAEFVTLAV